MIARARWSSADLTSKIKALVKEHKKLKDEPLLLAVHYRSSRKNAAEDVCVLEVLKGFGSGEVDPDRELFEVAYPGAPDLKLKKGQSLRLLLTNPAELVAALQDNWSLAKDLKTAVRQNAAEKIYAEPKEGEQLWKMLKDVVAANG
ncbi:MAG: hypothetical protein PHU85_04095 [Phycisphaerae bacterium]|nr:hypothetical protein [Phycisphaerae bacterium]